MEFNPSNPVIKLCIQGMEIEEIGNAEEASRLFLQAWNEATDDFEKYLAAYYVARHQEKVSAKLKWLETALEFALKVNNEATTSALPGLYAKIAQGYEELGDSASAHKNRELAESFKGDPSDPGPFYHGTKADMQIGELLTPGGTSNYQPELIMNHIYFTALPNGPDSRRL
ncbi:MAG TPA: NAD(+)--rifampin ADP-ribosyltransferase [Pyrinomonadaceae bacterium]|nr:NAD(+)--rifampin ADP-ribosyltransferase [Pyrinomonadaceae bacterium]